MAKETHLTSSNMYIFWLLARRFFGWTLCRAKKKAILNIGNYGYYASVLDGLAVVVVSIVYNA